MFIKLNKNTLYVNFNKHKLNYVICNIKVLPKKRICNYIHYTYRGIPLHLKQNNIIYHSTGKRYTVIIFIITQIQMENKTIYHYINK